MPILGPEKTKLLSRSRQLASKTPTPVSRETARDIDACEHARLSRERASL